ncbi:translation initiation factor IF-2 [Candidatus Palauibacter polyketidifaciens]|uniref:translation initiation factor IF-2 n=1 Tax=Candidatus Palauibacter polyketidifaciens TaxID=3056740 RepID=UPI00238E48A7|nr:translation initiation factor IF-2 [Candidatus Palauibacter polyketidifaciens]MDE2721073.1 translation initiation factor IF-2 [Candidatus Palauibacter polyketidifaciens]
MKRVFEVAEELRLDTSHLIQLLREMDVPVRSHMSSVDSASVARLHARLERERRGEAVTGTAAPVRRRRRRRRAAPASLTTATTEIEAEEEVQPPPEIAEEEAAAATDVPEIESPAEAETAVGTEIGPEPDVVTETPQPEPEVEPEAEIARELADEPEAPAPEADEPAAAEAPVETAESAETEIAEPEAEPAETEAAAEEPDAPARPARRPKPVRRDMPSPAAPSAPSGPRASAGPGGKVRISAEGYTVDGRKKSRGGDGKKRRRVDRNAVQQNFRKTLAAMGQSSPRKRRRETQQQQREAEREQRELEQRTEKATVRVNEFLTVSELADLIEVPPQAIITSAFKNLGLMVTINQRLDFGQIELICEEAGFTAIREEGFEADLASDDEDVPEDESQLVSRPPIVTVMGHVDHGKTSLLDRIRSTNVIAGEAGGITQHIGAYHVVLAGGRTITFLDTPGHEAFTAMRARGAEVTDIVILVVAADDSVMPQTIEAISHARNASVPIVVAVNKVDLPSADVDRVKRELLAREVVLEDFGGEILGAEVSAKTGEGLDDLLEKVLLQAEILELKANPEREARGTVVEAQLDRGMGPVATVLVERGTLEVGADFVCGLYGGRVRALLDERGRKVTSAGPGIPVRVLGMEGVPQAGDSLVALSAARVREIVSRRQQLEREKDIRRRATGTRLEDVFAAVKAGKGARLNVVIKGDTDGSVQALSDSLERLSTDEVSVEVIHRAVGGINESDILLASTSEAIIVGFHVRPDAGAVVAAERESIEIRIYNVIYEAVEEIRLALEGLLAPEQREITVGMAEIRELFRVPKAGTIAGCYVQSGTMRRNLPIRLLRDQIQIYQGRIDSLRRFKEDVREVKDGYECGISIENYNDIKVGDVIECYEVVEVARTLSGAPAG